MINHGAASRGPIFFGLVLTFIAIRARMGRPCDAGSMNTSNARPGRN